MQKTEDASIDTGHITISFAKGNFLMFTIAKIVIATEAAMLAVVTKANPSFGDICFSDIKNQYQKK